MFRNVLKHPRLIIRIILTVRKSLRRERVGYQYDRMEGRRKKSPLLTLLSHIGHTLRDVCVCARRERGFSPLSVRASERERESYFEAHRAANMEERQRILSRHDAVQTGTTTTHNERRSTTRWFLEGTVSGALLVFALAAVAVMVASSGGEGRAL